MEIELCCRLVSHPERISLALAVTNFDQRNTLPFCSDYSLGRYGCNALVIRTEKDTVRRIRRGHSFFHRKCTSNIHWLRIAVIRRNIGNLHGGRLNTLAHNHRTAKYFRLSIVVLERALNRCRAHLYRRNQTVLVNLCDRRPVCLPGNGFHRIHIHVLNGHLEGCAEINLFACRIQWGGCRLRAQQPGKPRKHRDRHAQHQEERNKLCSFPSHNPTSFLNKVVPPLYHIVLSHISQNCYNFLTIPFLIKDSLT